MEHCNSKFIKGIHISAAMKIAQIKNKENDDIPYTISEGSQ